MHPSPRCVVELRTAKTDKTTGKPADGIGSGYLIDEGWVLTAAHVVEGASSVRAWVDPPAKLTLESEAQVDVAGILRLEGVDWALVPLIRHRTPPGFVPAVFAQMDRQSTEPVPTVAMGFPWHRVRDAPANSNMPATSATAGSKMRAVLAAGGQITPANGSNTVTAGNPGHLTMTLTAAPGTATQPDANSSPTTNRLPASSVWAGMSGAAVWAGRLLVGVVVKHELREGAAALTVDPFPVATAPAVALLPNSPRLLRSTAGEVEQTYRLVAQELAPAALVERADEIAALDLFATDSAARWWWWEAEAFAGKTALTSWWVGYRANTDSAHEPSAGPRPGRVGQEGVAVVSCFLRRTRQHDTADNLVQDWAEQLGTLARPVQRQDRLRADRKGLVQLRQLISAAAEQCQRLVLIVDGLDEYSAAEPVPISDWLPRAGDLPRNAALLVTSRVGAPDRISEHHPLHQHRHLLHPSEIADEIRKLAEEEITHVTAAVEASLQRQILGFLAVAEAPLNIEELTTVMNWGRQRTDPGDIIAIWKRHLARTITNDPVSGGFAFSHDTLPGITRAKLEENLPEQRATIHAWADEYAARGWRDGTPTYLLHGYPRMLTNLCRSNQREFPRLATLVTDRARHATLRAATGGDAAALRDIASTIQLLTTDPADSDPFAAWRPGVCTHPAPDLATLALVVLCRDGLRTRNRSLPATLPAVWGSLGEISRAESLAHAIPDPKIRLEALTRLSVALTARGCWTDAARIAHGAQNTVDDVNQSDRALALAAVAEALANARQVEDAIRVADEAEQVAERIVDLNSRALALAAIAGAFGSARQVEDAIRVADETEQVVERIDSRDSQAVAFAMLARARAAAGQYHAAVPADYLPSSAFFEFGARDGALVTVVEALIRAGRFEEAWQVADRIHHVSFRAEALSALAGVSTLADGEAVQILAEAEEYAGRAVAGASQGAVQATAAVAGGWARRGQHDRAVWVMAQAERFAASTETDSRAEALSVLGAGFAAAGLDQDAARVAKEAEQVAASNDNIGARVMALSELVRALAEAGQEVAAVQVAASIDKPDSRARALAAAAEALAARGQQQAAVRVAANIDKPKARAQALAAAAEALAAAGHNKSAVRVAKKAEQVAASIDKPNPRAQALAAAAEALAAAGHNKSAVRVAEKAEQVAASIDKPNPRAQALTAAVKALAACGQHQEAERVAAAIDDHNWFRPEALRLVAAGLARDGKKKEAERVAGTIDDHTIRGMALLDVASGLVRAGSHQEAEQVASSITNHPYLRALGLTRIAAELARAGKHREAERVAAEAERNTVSIENRLWGWMRAPVVEALTAAGALEAAVWVAGIDRREAQAMALVQHDSADRVAAGGEDPDVHARMLAAIALALADQNDDRAARLIAAAWTVGEWPIPLRALARVQGSALAALARAVAGTRIGTV